MTHGATVKQTRDFPGSFPFTQSSHTIKGGFYGFKTGIGY